MIRLGRFALEKGFRFLTPSNAEIRINLTDKVKIDLTRMALT
jgi:hypothetical protein